jgi:hypothetical protein
MMEIKRFQIPAMILILLLVTACQAFPQVATVEPTATNPPPTSTPTEVPPSPTPTFTPTSVPEGICANILYPLLPGNEWVYQTSSTEGQSSMTFQVMGTLDDLASIHVVDQQAGIITDDTVRCADGAVVNLPMVFMSLMLSDYVDGVINTYQESGITAPSQKTFEENNWQYSWGAEKLVEQPIKVGIPELGSGHILRSNIIKFKSETTGMRESVTVPAGTFPQAILVSVEMRAPVTIGNSGVIFIVNYREWYEPYIGLLKIQTDSAGMDYTGFPVPVPLEKTLELLEYKQGAQ